MKARTLKYFGQTTAELGFSIVFRSIAIQPVYTPPEDCLDACTRGIGRESLETSHEEVQVLFAHSNLGIVTLLQHLNNVS
jgi:hypothetical protein